MAQPCCGGASRCLWMGRRQSQWQGPSWPPFGFRWAQWNEMHMFLIKLITHRGASTDFQTLHE